MKKIVAICLAALILIGSSIPIFSSRDNPDGYYNGNIGLNVEPPDVMASQETLRTVNPAEAQWLSDSTVTKATTDILYGQTPREGYILAPSMFGLSGIDTQSLFVLRTPTDYRNPPPITIDGQPEPNITREDGRTFIITPTIPLTSNSVYIFRLNRTDTDAETDITWAFQTTVRFEISSTLPRNQATNVPVRTGIEIAFSFGDEINIEDNFSIYPYVSGQFIHRDSTTIFMPTRPLENGRIYTVTISEGISLPETSEVITTGHSFSFETAQLERQLGRQRMSRPTSNVHFLHRNVEFPSFANPSVGFWVNNATNQRRPPVDMTVYRIEGRAQAIAATNRLVAIPDWSQLSWEDRFVDTSNLTRVYSETLYYRNIDESQRWRGETFTLSENLRPGFYVVNAVTDDSHNQMIIQITNLAVQVVADDNRTLLWINDMTTGLPAAAANVYDPVTGERITASQQGMAIIPRILSPVEYLIITATDGRQGVVFAHSLEFQQFRGNWGWGLGPQANNNYWTVLQLDRRLFQRSDTVSLWGFVQNRHQDEVVTHVTATLRQGSWERDALPLHTQNIVVQDGAYSGEIRLPNLDPGSYELAISHGDILLNSMFFQVRDYVTPPYRLNVTADINAIFAGEEVTFSARTEFFEGTPVSDLDISYNFQGRDLIAPSSGRGKTNLDGFLEMRVQPISANVEARGERNLQFSVEATLPEIGWVRQTASVRVFVNDISVRPRAVRTGADATLTVNVNYITLERINDGSAKHWGDFLGNPTEDQRISVEISEIYWQSIRDGVRYNHVTRQVDSWYRHERHERILERFEITTDADGTAIKNFSVPNRYRASYRARLTTVDGKGQTIVHDIFIGCDFTSFFQNATDDRLFLYGADSGGYDIGDSVELTIMRGAEPVTQGTFLFVIVQDGILSYHIGTNPLSFTFGEEHVPNAQVFAFHFNGHTYNSGWRMSQRLRFNPQGRQLNINITTCLETYRPGDMATFFVRTTDLRGIPKAANINISLVDEALFALMGYNVDTLAMLYRGIRDNLRFSAATHRTFTSEGIDEADSISAEPEGALGVLAASPPSADMAVEEETHIRERFEDTAVFASMRTNNRGKAEFTFRLPDNITSWRVTASAISDDLYAGNTVQNVNVTQPMFLHYTLGSVFLVGDRPYIGVNVYGTSLSGGEQVSFEVWRDNAPHDIRRASGASFARVNIPLWEKTAEGHGGITIRATVADYSDAIRHTYTVFNSHRQVDTAIFYEVTQNTVFDVNPGGLTNITFTDHGRGRFLNDLFSIRNVWWRSGARIEGFVARQEATNLITRHFPNINVFGSARRFNILDYQTPSGGIAILPQADADLYTTVMLIPFIIDDVNTVALTNYLRNIFNSSTSDNKVLALYGLAMLGEPVLMDLHRYSQLDLSVRNTAYIAMGFAVLGEMQAARELYDTRIATYLQAVAPYYRINISGTRAEILEATSVVSLLAARLGVPESLALHSYSSKHRFDAANREDMLLFSIERLNFISYEIENRTDDVASITYTLFGETITRDLSRGRPFTLRIPAQNMHEFSLVSVTGEVGAVSIVRTPLEDMEMIENDIVIRRDFFRAGTNVRTNTFEQGELVRVQITVDYSARSMSGSYMITDFLPAGLVHVQNSARFGDRDNTPGWRVWARTEGQRISFFDFNGHFDREHIYYYYARVISPGTFTAEGVFVQSLGARQYMAVGENAILTINS